MKYTDNDYTRDFLITTGLTIITMIAYLNDIVKALSSKRYGRAAGGFFGMLVGFAVWVVSIASSYELKKLCESESDDESENTEKIEEI